MLVALGKGGGRSGYAMIRKRVIFVCAWEQMSIQINDKRASGVLKRLYQDGQGYVATFLSKDRRLASNEDKKDKASVNPSNGLSQVLDFFAPLEQDNKLPGQSSSSGKLSLSPPPRHTRL